MKPMSEKQRNAVNACERILGISYTGEDTAQGAFFYLRDHIEDARKKLNKMIREEQLAHAPVQMASIQVNPIIDQMIFYRFDDAHYETGDEDETYAETPTKESLDRNIAYWGRFL